MQRQAAGKAISKDYLKEAFAWCSSYGFAHPEHSRVLRPVFTAVKTPDGLSARLYRGKDYGPPGCAGLPALPVGRTHPPRGAPPQDVQGRSVLISV